MSPDRPQNWFPALKHLRMGSASSLSFVIALSPCPALEHVQINFDSGAKLADANSAAALTASLSQRAKQLTSISIVRPVDAGIIYNVSTMKCLRHLSLQVRSGGAAQLPPGVHLPLESIDLDISPSQVDAMMDKSANLRVADMTPHSTAHCLSTLRRLTVAADGNGHTIVASIFRPRYLTSLDIGFLCHGDPIRSSLELPRILAVCLGQNPGIRVLEATGSLEGTPLAAAYRGARSTADFTSQFLSHLSSLKFLETIDITEVYLPTPGFLVDMLQMLRDFQRLTSFRFVPRHPTRRQHTWIVPTFDHLYQISKGRTPLSTLSTPVARPPCISVPSSFSPHRLRNLTLRFYPEKEGSSMTDGLVEISLYLHRIFPCLRSLTSQCGPSAQQNIWKLVESMLFAHQQILAKAIVDFHPRCRLQPIGE